MELKGVVRGPREGPCPFGLDSSKHAGLLNRLRATGDVSSLIGPDVMGIPGRIEVYEG